MEKMEQAMSKLTTYFKYEEYQFSAGPQRNICSPASNEVFKIVKLTYIESCNNNKNINNNNTETIMHNNNEKKKKLIQKNVCYIL